MHILLVFMLVSNFLFAFDIHCCYFAWKKRCEECLITLSVPRSNELDWINIFPWCQYIKSRNAHHMQKLEAKPWEPKNLLTEIKIGFDKLEYTKHPLFS